MFIISMSPPSVSMNFPTIAPRNSKLPRDLRTQRAMTLIEVTLVIAIIMGMIGALFFGMSAYKRGSNRALCIQNMATAQKAMRSYSNMNEAFPGSPVTDLKSEIVGPGKFLTSEPTCPGNGSYHFYGDGTDSTEDSIIPDIGTNYLRCSVVGHIPSNLVGW